MARNHQTRKPCVIEGCEALAVARGWCRKHYTRWHQHGDVETVIDQSRGICSIDGCKGAHKANGWCDAHYRRWQRHGDPLIQGKRRAKGTPEERFWGYVNKDGPIPLLRPELGPCWLWTGYVDPRTGYGQHGAERRAPYPAHTWGYERFVGPIPEGMEPDHLCRNTTCVNFERHLEPVTHSDNQRRAFAARVAEGKRKAHCPQGHPYVEGTFYLTKNARRVCKTCHAERARLSSDQRGVQRDENGRAIRALKTHCPRGHAYVEGNIYYTKIGGRCCKICTTDRNNVAAEKRKRMTSVTLTID